MQPKPWVALSVSRMIFTSTPRKPIPQQQHSIYNKIVLSQSVVAASANPYKMIQLNITLLVLSI